MFSPSYVTNYQRLFGINYSFVEFDISILYIYIHIYTYTYIYTHTHIHIHIHIYIYIFGSWRQNSTVVPPKGDPQIINCHAGQRKKRYGTYHIFLAYSLGGNGHLWWIYPLKMVIFHCGSLPEGKLEVPSIYKAYVRGYTPKNMN